MLYLIALCFVTALLPGNTLGQAQDKAANIVTVETQILKDIQQQIKIQAEKIKKIENQFTSQIKSIKNQITSLHDRQDLLEAQLTKQGVSSLPDRIHAFYARKTSDLPRVSADTIIVYENVVVNHGGFYNQNVGQYVAPLRGIYIFTMNALTISGHSFVHMAHNGQQVSRLWSGYYNNVNQSGSMMAILLLQQLDEVHTVLHSGHALQGNGYSHWGGFLLATV